MNIKSALWPVLLVTAIALGCLGAELHQQEHDTWIQFRTTHRCVDIGKTSPPAGISTTPGKTAWLCDDQLIHVHDTE